MTDYLDRLTANLADRYRIERELGQGGMATVYLADDIRHGRKVAVKVVHPELAAVLGAERFLSEIHVTAALQHPHILPLFDSGSAGGQLFYVMPYVEGESLRARLDRERQLPINDAVQLAREVASALDYAHRHGVVHRDIKPENVLLHDGQAVVADFGIALAVTNAGGGRLTQTGLSLGTPQYMSPEQATGEREIDARSDIYSLGAVTYEMLTGEPPFSGPTAQAIIAKVITTDPGSMGARRRSIPQHVEDAVLTALEKVPADRFGSAAEFADALRDPTRSRTGAAARRGAPVARSTPRKWQFAIAAAVLAMGVAAGWRLARSRASEAPMAQVAFNIPVDHRLTDADPLAALSPDGSLLVYSGIDGSGAWHLYARHLDELVPKSLPGGEGGCCASFSPDGKSLAFVDIPSGSWKRMAAEGGAATAIPGAEAGAEIVGLRWSGNDEFAVTRSDGSLGRLRSDGRIERLAVRDSLNKELGIAIQAVLPDGSFLAIGVTNPPLGNVVVLDHSGKNRTILPVPEADWAGYSSGHVVWAQAGGGLYAAAFDVRSKKMTGPIQSLGLTAQQTRGASSKVAAPGRNSLAFVPAQPLTLVRVGRNGTVTTLLERPRSYHSPRVSPDGKYIALDFAEATRDVWLLDISDNTLSRVTFENDGHDPQWLPDGKHFLFASVRQDLIGVLRGSIEGNTNADSVLMQKGAQITAHSVTPDGRMAIAVKFPIAAGPNGFADIVGIPLSGGEPLRPLVATRYDEQYPALSPDGRLLAYASNESNRMNVYIRPMSGDGGKLQVSQNGGTEPVWSRDGRELFFRNQGASDIQLISAVISTAPSLRVVSRTPLFKVDDYEAAIPHANYDVMPDGQSFVMVRQGRLSEFVYVQNWEQMLRQERRAEKR